MNPREIPDIQEAEELFQKAESSFPSEESAKDFKEAIEILNYYIEEESPETSVLQFISNLKHSYTRTAITKLNEIPLEDFHIFFFYYYLFMIKLEQEFEELTKVHPELQKAYYDCVNRFSPQLNEYLEELKKNL